MSPYTRNNRWKSESCAGIRDEFHRVVDLCPVELREICGYSRLEERWKGPGKGLSGHYSLEDHVMRSRFLVLWPFKFHACLSRMFIAWGEFLNFQREFLSLLFCYTQENFYP